MFITISLPKRSVELAHDNSLAWLFPYPLVTLALDKKVHEGGRGEELEGVKPGTRGG